MKFGWISATVIAAASGLWAADSDPAGAGAGAEIEKLVGHWRIASIREGGSERPADLIPDVRFSLAADGTCVLDCEEEGPEAAAGRRVRLPLRYRIEAAGALKSFRFVPPTDDAEETLEDHAPRAYEALGDLLIFREIPRPEASEADAVEPTRVVFRRVTAD